MSLTKEQAQEFAKKPAVICCRTTKGTKISASDLEDPTLFDELEETGVIDIPDDVLKIEEVLGADLQQDVEGLTALTADVLDPIEPQNESDNKPQESVETASVVNTGNNASSLVRLKAGQVSNLELEFPINGNVSSSIPFTNDEGKSEVSREEVRGELEKRAYNIKEVKIGSKTSIKKDVLTLNKAIFKEAQDSEKLVKTLEVDIITPDKRDIYTDSIMDVIPIATKVEGEVGEGVTNYLRGAVVMLTGTDENGLQVHEFGSCEGQLNEQVSFGKPGAPDEDDIIIRVHVILEENTGMERRGPYAAHRATDVIVQDVREQLKELSEEDSDDVQEMKDVRRQGRPRVVLVKEIMGQGAMHDNVMIPTEPAGVLGGRQNVDLGNVPVVLSVNEVRDGGIHALACIGPASKEVTRHYFREPLVEALVADEEFDVAGVVFIGSPQVNDEKMFVAKRLGKLVSTMNADGAIVTTEGFGNNHIDFAENIQQVEKQGLPVVGVSYCAYQGQLVVGNDYMDALVELNKDEEGIESEILAQNTLTPDDAQRAIQMLKNKISGVSILPSEKKWEQSVIDNNKKLLNEKRG